MSVFFDRFYALFESLINPYVSYDYLLPRKTHLPVAPAANPTMVHPTPNRSNFKQHQREYQRDPQ